MIDIPLEEPIKEDIYSYKFGKDLYRKGDSLDTNVVYNLFKDLTSTNFFSWGDVPPAIFVPAGSIVCYGGSVAPAGWLLCDGTAYSRGTYSDLFSVISTLYGTGDGSTTFNVPDFRGRGPMGLNTGTFTPRGKTGGEETHILTTAEMPIHAHVMKTIGAAGTDNTRVARGDVGGTLDQNTQNEGGGGAHNVLNPYLVVNFIIKT